MESTPEANNVPDVHLDTKLSGRVREDNVRQRRRNNLDAQSETNKEDTGERSQDKVGVTFIDEKTDQTFEKLKSGNHKEKQLYKWISRAIDDLKTDPNCAIRIPKKFWPNYYNKHEITNLWKYDLPNAWRLIYTITKTKILVLCVILEWFDHKKYQLRFGYGNR